MRYISIPGVPPVSVVGFGLIAATPSTLPDVAEVLDEFIEAGGTLIDSAHTYGGGDADRALGMWLSGRKRHSVVVLAKGGHPLDDGRPRVNAAALRQDLDETLQRIASDYVDVFMLHRDDPSVPVAQILEITEEIRQDGQATAFGVSNWTPARIAEANEYASSHGLTPFAVNSPGMSLAIAREPMWPGCVYVDDELTAFHESTRMPLAAWSAQARGFFSGRIRRGGPIDPELARVYGSDGNFDRLERATQLAEQRGFTANQVALAFVLASGFPVTALITPKSPAQLHDSLRALELELTPANCEWLATGRRAD